MINLIKNADEKIILIDNYIDVDTLNILCKKKQNVSVSIYTLKQTRLTAKDIENFNKQYPKLELKYTKAFHDRFIILDDIQAYHIGASIKDAGKKCFGINLIKDERIIRDILERLEIESSN